MSETDLGQLGTDTDVDNQGKGQQIIEISDLSSTSINDLGEYELIKIFGYFPFKDRLDFGLVCNKWMYCVDESFKSEKVLDSLLIDPNFDGSHKLMALLIKKCHNVRHIGLTEVVFSYHKQMEKVEDLIETVVANCSQLKSIDFGYIQDLDEVFKRNANYFLQLKKIVSKNISGEALNCIIGSENLETIDVNKNERLINVDFKRLGPKIRELHLIESNVYKTDAIKDLCEGNGTQIEILSIDISEKKVLSLICNNLKKLKKLKLFLDSKDCDFKQLANLIDLYSLQTIDSGASIFDPVLKRKEFIDLIKSLKVTKITELIVDLIKANNEGSDDSLHELQKNCPFLGKLVIKWAVLFTGRGMYSISQMKNLRHLNLTHCERIDDEIIIVITCCPLRELILHSCFRITNDTVLAFIEKAKTSPNEEFCLDVSRTNVREESLPLFEDRPKNLGILFETDCKCCFDHLSDELSDADSYGADYFDWSDTDLEPEDFDPENYEYYDDY